MTNFMVLLKGELQRMQKYNILAASLFVSALWIGVLYFIDIEDVTSIFPLLIFLDATSIAIIMIGASMFFEKQEGALKSLLISPINKGEYILSKAIANIISSIISLLILYLYAWYFKELSVNLATLIGAVVLVSFFHSLIGFVVTFYSKDFTDMLIGMMKYFLVLMIPVLFEWLGLIASELVTNLLYLLPTKASMIVLTASSGAPEVWESVFSALYLITISVILYIVVLRKFDEFAVKESGV